MRQSIPDFSIIGNHLIGVIDGTSPLTHPELVLALVFVTLSEKVNPFTMLHALMKLTFIDAFAALLQLAYIPQYLPLPSNLPSWLNSPS